MLEVPRARWASFVPTRWSWLRLLARPSSFVLVIALVATAAAKARVFRGLEDIEFWPGRWLVASASDIAVFLGLAAVFALAERSWQRAHLVTIPLAVIVALLSVISAIQLWITGEQLSAQVVVLALERFGDVTKMANATLHLGILAGIALPVVLGGVPTAASLVLRRVNQARTRSADAEDRGRAAACMLVFAFALMVVAPVPAQLTELYRNATVHTIWDLVRGDRSWNGGLGLFAGYEPHDLIDKSSIDDLRARPRPNVLVLILESTRRDATDLDPAHSHARTPNLVALAQRGLEVTHARAVIPHTTKSMWSMMCGRLPILQSKLYETRSTDVQCLPHILAAAGWRTGFLQSAVGRFEDRPRLIKRLGFGEFLAAEQFTKEVAGYLSTDDEALVEQLRKWLDKSAASPFMVTLLTSSTHHPYLLTEESIARAKEQGLPTATDRDRYDRQIEASDHLLGGVLDLLRQRGVLDNTIVVVVGDHGEGFGEKLARQHALNFYEEGLRVPWVIAGPNVPVQKVSANTSLLDLAPTLLDLLGVQLSAAAMQGTHARSVLKVAPDRALPFSCFFDKSCFGFVLNDMKVVSMREAGHTFAFDLAADPDERTPLPLTPELTKALEVVQHVVDLHRTNSQPKEREPMLDFWPWNCPRDQACGIKESDLR